MCIYVCVTTFYMCKIKNIVVLTALPDRISKQVSKFEKSNNIFLIRIRICVLCLTFVNSLKSYFCVSLYRNRMGQFAKRI